jgi:hypothetical protein
MTAPSVPTTVHPGTIGELLRTHSKDELLRSMGPERRALFHRILALRERIGPVRFDVVEALREMREDG